MLSYPRHDPPWLSLHAGGEVGGMESWYRGVTDLPGPGSILPGHININTALVFHGMSQSIVMWSRELSGSSILRSLRWHPCTMRRWQAVNNSITDILIFHFGSTAKDVLWPQVGTMRSQRQSWMRCSLRIPLQSVLQPGKMFRQTSC